MADASPSRRPHHLSHQGAGSTGPVAAVADFGRTVADKLWRGGDPEDQLRGPVEVLLKRLALHMGLDAVAYGEVSLRRLRARPDYAVDVGGARIGYVELKAPGRGVPPQWKPDRRERQQWKKLAALPNVIYTDGTSWGRYSFGEPAGPVVHLDGSLDDTPQPLRPPDQSFESLIREFLTWEPERPRSLAEFIRTIAGLSRLLRDEVAAIMAGTPDHAAHEDLTLLAEDWRELLFPGLDDAGFADAYAQSIAYAMLLARVDGISFRDTPLPEIARQLGKTHSLMGRAFEVLLISEATDEMRTIETLRQVIGAVDWDALDDGHTDVYADLYERFLQQYDPELRKHSGSYYTPEPVARFQVDFVNEILRTRLGRSWGFASDDVVVVDPAMGTGTFLVEIIRVVADTVDEKQGRGARPERLRDLFAARLVGFEKQVAPYAVAELRLHHALKTRFYTEIPRTDVRFLTDALDNPRQRQERIRAAHKIIERSREEANRIKREVPVMVVIGNPPHVENAKGQAPWIEQRRDPKLQPPSTRQQPSLDEFRAEGLGRYESDLHGMPWYFWRWATWKVFEAHPDEDAGVVAFVTPGSLIRGTAFAGVRQYLRSTCDEGWIIDLSPEGNRSKISTRVFGAKVSRGLCIAVFARYGNADADRPAQVHHVALEGNHEEKLDQLRSLHPDGGTWATCRNGWLANFLPGHESGWERYPTLAELLPWRSPGVTTGRAWVYAPDRETLERRWREFVAAAPERRRVLLDEGHDRKLDSRVAPLPGFRPADGPLSAEGGDCPAPVPVAYRSFDRQWVISDKRLMERPRTALWAVRSDLQIYVSEQHSHPISSGPGLVFTALIPDMDHFNGRVGGVHPLYRDPEGSEPNVAPGLTRHLSRHLGLDINASELLAYIAAVTAHPGYTARFQRELREPGVRVPLTADPDLWTEAAPVGREIVWLHTFGERFVDDTAGRPRGALALAERSGTKVTAPITTTTGEMPETIHYDEQTRTLLVGKGRIRPVEPAVWAYEVGGMQILPHWFDYRTSDPRYKKRTSPLDGINLPRWSSQLTDELLAVLAVLTRCVALEPRQRDLLTRVCEGPLITVDDLTDARLLPVPKTAAKEPRRDTTAERLID